jgi:putative DNA primase/helicase
LWSAARSYAKAGIYVNPVYVTRKPDGKKDVRPVGLWRNTSSRSLADIGAWEQEHPDAQLLIDCGKSNLVVVDCDGQEGVANWLELIGDALGDALGAAATPSGGRHYFYRAHPDHPIGNDQSGKVARNVDVRGLGGFVFAPPSHDGSGSWRWIKEPDWSAPGHLVPDVVTTRMAYRSAPAGKPTPSGQDLFEDAAREFTRDQARKWINDAGIKLKSADTGLNGVINEFAMTCAHFPWLVDRDKCAELMIRWLGKRQGWSAPDRDDIATINSAYSATEAGKSWVGVQVVAPPTAAGNEDGAVPSVLPPPGQPVKVARELIGGMPASDGVPHWAWWREDFYRWSGAHWDVAEQAVIDQWLYEQTADATYFTPAKKDGEEPVSTPWAPTRKKIGDLAHALGVGLLQRHGDEDRVIAAANGVVDLITREVVPHSPARFNLFSLPFDYDPCATAPKWQEFLDDVLPGDKQSQEFLGEWFGYVLSGRTDQHKIAALIGKKRSGKGTVARVLGALAGRDNVAGMNLSALSGTFGLEPFIGAALAVASDVRWKSRNIGDAVQILLEISGEDAATVSRKNRKAWKGKLGVRFMLMSNDTPTFSDRSGALVDRMIYVSFRQSFFGREDAGLTEKLIGELPGIFNWALDGLERLNGRGRFTQPESGVGEQEATRRLADPVGAFLEDWCVIDTDSEIVLDHLYLKFRNWCESEGRDRDSTTKEIFSRDLRSKLDGLTSRRTRENGKFVTILKGIGCSAL